MRDLSEIKKANEEFEAREKAGAFDEESEIDNGIVKRAGGIQGEREDVSGFDNVDRTDQVGQERFPPCGTCNGTGSVVVIVRDRITSTAPCGMCGGSGQAGL